MTKYILSIFFVLCVQNVNAEVKPIQGGGSSSSSSQVLVKTSTNAFSNTYNATAAAMPCDNSIPQITEGILVASTTVTASAAGNKFRIYVNGMLSAAAAQFAVCAVFKDTTANAIQDSGRCQYITGANQIEIFTIIAENVAGDTSPHLYTVRCGMADGATFQVNFTDSERKLGGNAAFSIFVDEIVPN
jgi:hypothetical protein